MTKINMSHNIIAHVPWQTECKNPVEYLRKFHIQQQEAEKFVKRIPFDKLTRFTIRAFLREFFLLKYRKIKWTSHVIDKYINSSFDHQYLEQSIIELKSLLIH